MSTGGRDGERAELPGVGGTFGVVGEGRAESPPLLGRGAALLGVILPSDGTRDVRAEAGPLPALAPKPSGAYCSLFGTDGRRSRSDDDAVKDIGLSSRFCASRNGDDVALLRTLTEADLGGGPGGSSPSTCDAAARSWNVDRSSNGAARAELPERVRSRLGS